MFSENFRKGLFGSIVNIRNESLIFWVHGEWIGTRDKQIAWTAKRFSGDLFVPRSDSFPMNPEKDTHFLIEENRKPFFFHIAFLHFNNRSLILFLTFHANISIKKYINEQDIWRRSHKLNREGNKINKSQEYSISIYSFVQLCC